MTDDLTHIKNAGTAICKVAAKRLADSLEFCRSIDKVSSSEFTARPNGYNVGDTITINKPARFQVNDGPDITAQIQDIKEERIQLTLDTRKNVAVDLDTKELTTDMGFKSFSNRVVIPAVESIAQHVESEFLEKAKNATYNSVGTPGSTVFGTATMVGANQRIDENACPSRMSRFALLNPAGNTSAVIERKDSFNKQMSIAKQYETGYMGYADGFTYLTNNLLPTHTNGTDVAGLAINGAVGEGVSVIAVSGLTAAAGALSEGTVFTIDGIFAVHPITKMTLTHLQQFVVTADVDGTAGTVPIEPAIYSAASAGLQNVSALPVGGEAITVMGAAGTGYGQNLAYHKNAYRMVSVPLVTPRGVDLVASHTYDGITVRLIRDFDIKTDKVITRLDYFGGFVAARPEWAARVYS